MKKLRAVLGLALLSVLIIISVPIFGVEAQETLLWGPVDLYSGPTQISLTTPFPLEAGRTYRIEAKGSFISCHPIWGYVVTAMDPQYYTNEFFGAFPSNWWFWTSPIKASPSILRINGMGVDWGPFSNGGTYWWEGHEYSAYYVGAGAPITFTIEDPDGDYVHNFSHFVIKIYVGPPPPPPEGGKSPGYWKHEFNAYADLIVGVRPKGEPHETWANLVMWTKDIDKEARKPTRPWDLPPLGKIDYDGDGTFTTLDAYKIFNAGRSDPAFKLWLPLANWYNWAAGYGYYT